MRRVLGPARGRSFAVYEGGRHESERWRIIKLHKQWAGRYLLSS